MFKILIPAVAALGLVAFTAQTADLEPASAAADTAVMTQPVMGWSLHHEGSMAKLAYGVANSDQLALMMTCSPGDATAVIYGDVQPADARLVQASLIGADPMDGGMAESRISLTDSALQRLADVGRIDVAGDAGVFRVNASAAEKQAVRAFLDYCGQTHA